MRIVANRLQALTQSGPCRLPYRYAARTSYIALAIDKDPSDFYCPATLGAQMRKLALAAAALAFTGSAYAADVPLKAAPTDGCSGLSIQLGGLVYRPQCWRRMDARILCHPPSGDISHQSFR